MSIIVYVDGDRRADISANDVSVRDEFHVERGTIHLFTKEEAMAKWLNSSGYAVYYQRCLAVHAQLRRDLKVLKTRERSLAQAIAAEEANGRKAVEKLLKQHKVALGDSKQLSKLIADYMPGSRVRPLSTFLYDGPSYTGSWRWLRHGIQIPKLSWISFNDMTTSLRVFGENTVLCQHTWWWWEPRLVWRASLLGGRSDRPMVEQPSLVGIQLLNDVHRGASRAVEGLFGRKAKRLFRKSEWRSCAA